MTAPTADRLRDIRSDMLAVLSSVRDGDLGAEEVLAALLPHIGRCVAIERAESEKLRAQLIQANDLSRGARAAVVELRAENERLRTWRAAALDLAWKWSRMNSLARDPRPDVAARAQTLQSAAADVRRLLGAEE